MHLISSISVSCNRHTINRSLAQLTANIQLNGSHEFWLLHAILTCSYSFSFIFLNLCCTAWNSSGACSLTISPHYSLFYITHLYSPRRNNSKVCHRAPFSRVLLGGAESHQHSSKEWVHYVTGFNVVSLIQALVIAVILTLLHKYVSSLSEIWQIYL